MTAQQGRYADIPTVELLREIARRDDLIAAVEDIPGAFALEFMSNPPQWHLGIPRVEG